MLIVYECCIGIVCECLFMCLNKSILIFFKHFSYFMYFIRYRFFCFIGFQSFLSSVDLPSLLNDCVAYRSSMTQLCINFFANSLLDAVDKNNNFDFDKQEMQMCIYLNFLFYIYEQFYFMMLSK